MDIASVRILRLAVGTAVSLWFSQAIAWPLSFIAPVITMFVLALPFPAPKLKQGIGLMLVLAGSLYAGLLLLPPLLNWPIVGVILLIIALYWSFYFTAKGGSAALGTFATMGIAVSTAIGTVNLDAVLAVIGGVSFGAAVGVLFVWVAHALLPDSMAVPAEQAAPAKPAAPPKPDLSEARRSAFRSLMIVLPIALWFLFSSASATYVPVMIKVAAMGQQATNDGTRQAGRSLIMSTIIGGAGAIVGWQLLSITPQLSIYALIVLVAGLVMGPRIFKGPGMHAHADTWSYALLTMIVILAPAVMDGIGGTPAGTKFWDRLIMFLAATVYAVATVYVFDAFTAARRKLVANPRL